MKPVIRDHAARTASMLIPELPPECIPGATSPRPSPERALVAAVIRQAIDDARGLVSGVTYAPEQRRVKRAARQWLRDAESGNHLCGATWGLKFCAEIVGEEATRFAAIVPKLRKKMPALQRLRARGGPRPTARPARERSAA